MSQGPISLKEAIVMVFVIGIFTIVIKTKEIFSYKRKKKG
jgi:hypothetical protein